jgi:hypothetical protein
MFRGDVGEVEVGIATEAGKFVKLGSKSERLNDGALRLGKLSVEIVNAL